MLLATASTLADPTSDRGAPSNRFRLVDPTASLLNKERCPTPSRASSINAFWMLSRPCLASAVKTPLHSSRAVLLLISVDAGRELGQIGQIAPCQIAFEDDPRDGWHHHGRNHQAPRLAAECLCLCLHER